MADNMSWAGNEQNESETSCTRIQSRYQSAWGKSSCQKDTKDTLKRFPLAKDGTICASKRIISVVS